MKEKILQKILWQAPFGYAYHKLLLNDRGLPEDYVFLDANPAFEKMTGLNRKAILGKRASEALTNIRKNGFDWVGFYGEVVLTGEGKEITQYFEPLGRWYKITAFSPETDHFVTVFQEITPEMQQIKTLETQTQKINELTTELETVFNGAQDAMFIVRHKNGEFRYIKNNAAHQKLTGLGISDLKGKTPVELIGKEQGEIINANYQRCVDSQEPIAYEETLVLPSGEKTWLTSLTPVTKKGKVKYLVGASRDITEREDLLKRLQSMFAGHDAVMLLIEPITGKIVDANPAACTFYGYTRKELTGMYTHDLNMLPRKEIKKQRLLALQGKKKRFIFPHRLKNGEKKTVEVYSSPIAYGRETLIFSIIFDVTSREEYKEKLYREKEMLRTVFLSIGDGVVTTDREGRITALNRVAEEITGWSEKEAAGRPFSEVFKLISETTGKEIENPAAKVLHTGKTAGLANHTSLLNKDGRQVPIADSAAPIRDDTGQVLGAVMVFRDVTKEKAQQEKILYLSYHDALTGLYNRRFMEEEMKRLDASREIPLAVIMGDVNGLKLTNDVFGHDAGDHLIKHAAAVMRDSCRKGDILARWGGDEFVLLLPRTGAKAAEKIVERIKSRCLQKKGGAIQLSIALGFAVKETMTNSLWQALKEAEDLMYRSKLREGKSYRKGITDTLLATLAAKSMETEQHAERLQNYCLAMGKQLRLPIKEMEELALLAILHDIGKVGISESVLKKPGQLTAEEWEEIKKHPAIGYRIAQNTPELAAVAEYILGHHERWDGRGYPRGLKGEEIPLLCRILAVADAYDAMTNDRTYRQAMSPKEALTEIEKNAGTQFDPQVVKVFLAAMTAEAR